MEAVAHPRTTSTARPIGQHAWLCPPRTDQAEMLDLNAGSPEDVRANLREMWLINRRLGGLNALTRHLLPRLLSASQPLRLLDLGTGGAEIPLYLLRWAQSQNVALDIIGIDWSIRNLAVADENVGNSHSIQLLRADASELPLLPDSVDYVISSLFLHHFTADQVIHLIRAAYQCANRGIIMTDLVRGYPPLIAFKMIQPIFARNWLTRHDGALSIYRAYTSDELRHLAAEAGLPHARVSTHWPWRMTLVAEKSLEHA